MKHIIRIIMMVCVLAGASQAVKAEGASNYFGIGIGQGSVSHKQNSLATTYPTIPASADVEDSKFGLHLLMGSWFDEYLGLELTLQDIPNYKAKNNTAQFEIYGVENISVFVTTRKNVFGQEFFAKAGLSFWSICGNADCGDELESGQSLAYGAGVNVNIYDSNERMMRLEWEHTAIDSIYIDSLDIISLNIVFSYDFQ